MNLLAPALIATAARTKAFERNGNRVPAHSPSAVFRCTGEDNWCAVAARDDREWRGIARVLGQPLLAGDPRFATLSDRKRNEDELESILAKHIQGWDRWELARALQNQGVPAWPVLSSGDMLEDAQLRARGFWRTLDHPVMGETTAAAAPFKADGERTGPTRPAPLLGEHTREVARSLLDLTDAEIDELAAEKALW